MRGLGLVKKIHRLGLGAIRKMNGYPDMTVRMIIPGEQPLGQKVCFFSHFDESGSIGKPTLHYLEHLKQCGFSSILVSTSPKLAQSAIDAARAHSHSLIIRDNFGLDFASWKAGLACFPSFPSQGAVDGVLFANDSVFGPLQPLAGLFDKMDSEPNAMWGMTSSYERAHHLQSYFLYFPREIYQSGFVTRFFRTVACLDDKEEIIDRYEIGISQAALHEGHAIRALFPLETVQSYAEQSVSDFQYPEKLGREHLNPTLFLWDHLVEGLGFPFIKTEILRKDRFQAQRLDQWRAIISRCSIDISKEIESFLSSKKPPAAIFRT